ncbi:MAG TPA: HAD-IIA family hydrolase [Streptosporangiaceae bacterium]|nr:HAD-IIA family hydrolase [Streptosporangiaceae bacterium]
MTAGPAAEHAQSRQAAPLHPEPGQAAQGLHRPERIFAGYALDLDGTVYLGDALLPGAAETVARIRQSGSRLVFLTNNPLRSAASYAQRLSRLGIPAAGADVLTPLGVLTSYLRRRHAGAAVLTVAEPLVDETLAAAGITVTSEPAAAGVVVVSFDRTFSYAKLLLAYRAVRHFGAVIVATNPDPFCPTPDGGWPDCAAMLAAVEVCTQARAEAVMGKPGEHMAAELLRRLGAPPGGTAIVGDRLSTDVSMSGSLGMTSVLVLSGATTPDELAGSPVRPDYVIEGIGQLLPADPPGGPPARAAAGRAAASRAIAPATSPGTGPAASSPDGLQPAAGENPSVQALPIAPPTGSSR